MITSVVGRLIKTPELVERIHIPGKRVIAFTIVQNSQRGEKRLSVFFNLSMVIATEPQFEMVMRLEKGTVLLFSAPRITYVKQVDRDEHEQVINLYAEIDNFRIVAGAAAGIAGATADAPPPSAHPADAPGFDEEQQAPTAPPQQQQQQRGLRPGAPDRASATPQQQRRPVPPPSAPVGSAPRTAAAAAAAAPAEDSVYGEEDADYDPGSAAALPSADSLSDLSDPFEDEPHSYGEAASQPPPPAPASARRSGAAGPPAHAVNSASAPASAPAPTRGQGTPPTPAAAAAQNRQNQDRPQRQRRQEPEAATEEEEDPFA